MCQSTEVSVGFKASPPSAWIFVTPRDLTAVSCLAASVHIVLRVVWGFSLEEAQLEEQKMSLQNYSLTVSLG